MSKQKFEGGELLIYLLFNEDGVYQYEYIKYNNMMSASMNEYYFLVVLACCRVIKINLI